MAKHAPGKRPRRGGNRLQDRTRNPLHRHPRQALWCEYEGQRTVPLHAPGEVGWRCGGRCVGAFPSTDAGMYSSSVVASIVYIVSLLLSTHIYLLLTAHRLSACYLCLLPVSAACVCCLFLCMSTILLTAISYPCLSMSTHLLSLLPVLTPCPYHRSLSPVSITCVYVCVYVCEASRVRERQEDADPLLV